MQSMHWVTNDGELAEVLPKFEATSTYFIDTEFESNKRGTRLSVIQVGIDEDVFLLDALSLTNLERLAGALLRPKALWVLHAGLQDVALLLDCLAGTTAPRLFDTQLAWALLGPEASVSLSYLQFRVLGLRSMKTHQADDWMRRPLPKAQLQYAAADVEHLPALYSALSERLAEKHRLDVVDEVCREAFAPPEPPSDELTLESFRHAWQLEPPNQAALQFVVRWYNALPRPDKVRVPPPKTLLALVSRLPRSTKDLARIKGVSPQFNGPLANALVQGMSRAAARASSADFIQLDPIPYTTFEDLRLEAWLNYMRAEVSAAVEVAPELAFPTRLLKRAREIVAERGAAHWCESLEGWRRTLLREAVAEYLQRHPAPVASSAT